MKHLPPRPADPLWEESRFRDALEVHRQAIPWRSLGYAYAYEVRRDRALSTLQALVPPPARVLDVGAGGGNFALPLAEAGYRVTWNDLRAELIPIVQAKHERGEIAYLVANLFELEPTTTVPFDAILATEVIEHCAHPDAFLRRMASLLRPGGLLVMTTPLGSYLRNPLPRFSEFPNPEIFEGRQFLPDSDGHIFLLHLDEMADLAAKAGLAVERLEVQINPLTNGHMKLWLLLPLLPRRLVFALERLGRRLPGRLARRLHTSMLAVLRRPG